MPPRSRPASASPTVRLLRWYDRHRRDLPWRRRPTPYRVWVSEIMLQQTQVNTVIPYYRRFMKRFPSLRALATAELEEVLPLWSGLGYYRRVRHLHAAAREVTERFRGRFPRDLESALALPGVGAYTAPAVLSIALGEPHPVLDGNVERVLARVLALAGDPTRSAGKRRLLEQARAWMPTGRPGDFNQALMELGALVCNPTSPRCTDCPLAADCRALAGGRPTAYPVRPPRRRSVKVRLAAVVVERAGRYLLERLDPEAATGPAYLRGVWIFPTHEVPPDTGVESSLRAGLEREGDGRLRLAGRLGEVKHSITHRRITLEAWRARGAPGRTGDADVKGRERAWLRPDELGATRAIPALTRKVLELVEKPGRQR